MRYSWQFPEWPEFTYDLQAIQPLFIAFAKESGELTGIYQSLKEDLRQEAILQIMVSEAVKSSEIEGEYVSRQEVMSSLRKNLGLVNQSVPLKDKRAKGIAELMLAVCANFNKKLTIGIVQNWHTLLMTGNNYVAVGSWRKGEEPMQVVSGSIGKEEIHFEAPPSDSVPALMKGFIEWYNKEDFGKLDNISQALLKSSIAHLYFETIHPFEDGNGRIGRAIAEHALSYSLKSPVLLSLSKSIEKDRKLYYNKLKKAQKTIEITDWLVYFINIIINAQKEAKSIAQLTVQKALIFEKFSAILNDRQVVTIKRLFEAEPEGFEGGMTAKKYMKISKTSKATATRDLQKLINLGILKSEGAGRSVRYRLSKNNLESI